MSQIGLPSILILCDECEKEKKYEDWKKTEEYGEVPGICCCSSTQELADQCHTICDGCEYRICPMWLGIFKNPKMQGESMLIHVGK